MQSKLIYNHAIDSLDRAYEAWLCGRRGFFGSRYEYGTAMGLLSGWDIDDSHILRHRGCGGIHRYTIEQAAAERSVLRRLRRERTRWNSKHPLLADIAHVFNRHEFGVTCVEITRLDLLALAKAGYRVDVSKGV